MSLPGPIAGRSPCAAEPQTEKDRPPQAPRGRAAGVLLGDAACWWSSCRGQPGPVGQAGRPMRMRGGAALRLPVVADDGQFYTVRSVLHALLVLGMRFRSRYAPGEPMPFQGTTRRWLLNRTGRLVAGLEESAASGCESSALPVVDRWDSNLRLSHANSALRFSYRPCEKNAAATASRWTRSSPLRLCCRASGRVGPASRYRCAVVREQPFLNTNSWSVPEHLALRMLLPERREAFSPAPPTAPETDQPDQPERVSTPVAITPTHNRHRGAWAGGAYRFRIGWQWPRWSGGSEDPAACTAGSRFAGVASG